MASNASPRVHPVLPLFDRVDIIYKTLNGIDFDAAILVPKTLLSSDGKAISPLLVHFHGGALLMGTNLDVEILSVWLVRQF
jgi:acetyl esterase/lipase